MLTRVDHWLREKFILQTHVYTLRLPAELPRGIKVSELPATPSNQFKYRLVANSNALTNKLVDKLGEGGMMFKTQVVEKKTFMKPLICPKGGSVILTAFWLVSVIGLSFGSFKLFKTVSEDEVLMENIRGAVAIFTETGDL